MSRLKEFFEEDITLVAEILYKGKGVSFNQIYSSGTWYTRSSIKNKYKKIFLALLNENEDIRWMGQYLVDLSYNSRHDPDNVVAMEKIFIDTIKQDVDPKGNVLYEGYIKDDSKRYCRGVILRPDESLPYNSFKFALYEYGK
jgi:hypothetical protein